jgi:ComF family protein
MLSNFFQNTVSEITKFKETVADILFPRACFHCEKEGVWLCEEGKRSLLRYESYRCAVCNIPLKGPTMMTLSSNACRRCCKELQVDGLFIAAEFRDSIIRDMIHALKYEYVEEVAILLAEMTGEMLQKRLIHGRYQLLPVPLHRRRLLFRGFNQAELIATHISARYDVPLLHDALLRLYNTSSQVELDRDERMENMQGIFFLQKLPSSSRAVVLLDDVMTTGATLRECARVLRLGGVQQVFAAVVAKG